MRKVEKVEALNNYTLICTFNTGERKVLHMAPILEQQKNLAGIAKLKEWDIFKGAMVGEAGQILWPNIIEINTNNIPALWDYDISPEYAFHHSEPV
jgi:hypothetical protein